MNTTKIVQYRFLIIFTLFIFILLPSCKSDQPPIFVGDEFVVETANKTFTLYKVVKIEKKNIWYIQNDYDVSEKKFLDSILSPNQYTDAPIKIELKAFKKLSIKFYKNRTTLNDTIK